MRRNLFANKSRNRAREREVLSNIASIHMRPHAPFFSGSVPVSTSRITSCTSSECRTAAAVADAATPSHSTSQESACACSSCACECYQSYRFGIPEWLTRMPNTNNAPSLTSGESIWRHLRTTCIPPRPRNSSLCGAVKPSVRETQRV